MKSAYLWDIFCKVIDNFGDIGVCWRLAANLAARGQRVRLWIDDPGALSWLAPGALTGGHPGISVRTWEQSLDPAVLATLPQADVWVEGFGCEIASEFLAHPFSTGRHGATSRPTQPVWVNLEYLSAERFARCAHGLASPVLDGTAKGCTKYFYYPGFGPDSGGLLREPGLEQRQARFDPVPWLASQGIDWHGERLVSLFCYQPRALADVLAQLRDDARPTRLLVTDGLAAAAVRQVLDHPRWHSGVDATGNPGSLSTTFLPRLSQTDFDHLLWSCDLNFVRGEDSLVRAIWAGKPFVWQIYPQHDDAHHAKLEAFLDVMLAGPSWRLFHRVWNAMVTTALPATDLHVWGASVEYARQTLIAQSDLTTRLLQFVQARRSAAFPNPEQR